MKQVATTPIACLHRLLSRSTAGKESGNGKAFRRQRALRWLVRSIIIRRSTPHALCFPIGTSTPALEQTSDTTHPPSPRLDSHGRPAWVLPTPLVAWELSEVRGRAPPLADQWVTSGHFPPPSPPNPVGLAGDPFLGTESCFDNVRVSGS